MPPNTVNHSPFFNLGPLKRKFLLFLFLLIPILAWSFFPFSSSPPEPALRPDLVEKIARTTAIIQRNYYDPQRIKPEKIFREGLKDLARKIPELQANDLKDQPSKITLILGKQTAGLTLPPFNKISDIIKPASQVFSFVKDNYTGEVKPADQEYAFIGGMLKTLDPHSNLLTPEVFREFKTQTEGEYGGIGIVIGIRDEELAVIAPLEGTPAARLGVQSEDKILEIDHQPTINMPLSEAVEKLRGKPATKVVLLLQRKNREPWEITVIREKINIISVRSKVVIENAKRVGVLSIRSFQEETFSTMEKALTAMTEGNQSLSGLVLDLRNNPGGLLDQAIDMADKFLSQGDILYTVGAANTDEEVAVAHPGNDISSVPMIVLVNQGSASASEIVAGALKNNNRALVLGSQTFGKGSVQSLFSLKDDSAVKLTIAQYLTPGRVSIQAVGITPDVRFVPALVSKDGFDLWDDEPEGEKGLEEHLENSAYVKISKPDFQLHFLDEVKDEKAKEKETDYIYKIDESKDYLLRLAVKLLAHGAQIQRPELLSQSLPLLKQEAKKQDEDITGSLKKYEIDWSPLAANSTKPTLEFSFQFTDKKTGLPLTRLEAGTEANLTLTATNKGSQEARRVIGIVKAENPLLDKREFVFGLLAPGASKKATVSFKIPDENLSFDEKIFVNFHQGEGDAFARYAINTRFVEKPKPVLAYSYELKDDGSNGSKGNANGLPEKGEILALLVHVVNKSANPAGDVQLNLKNVDGDGIFLREGRAVLGAVAPNSGKDGRLVFEIAKSFPKNEMKLDFGLIDKKTRTTLVDSFRFNLSGSASAKAGFDPPPSRLQIPPVITVLKQDYKPEGKSVHLEGTAGDDIGLSDLMIYNDGDKVFYKAPAPTDGKTVAFSADVPVKDGANYILIEARDGRKLTASKIIPVFLPEKTEK